MRTAKKRKPESPAANQTTPLVNLFAYIRDLFNTAEPKLRFDQNAARNKDWWLMHDWVQLSGTEQHPDFDLQFDHPDQPLLTLKRSESSTPPTIPTALQGWLDIDPEAEDAVRSKSKTEVSFTSDPERVRIFRDFQSQIQGKPLDEVQNLSIPSILNQWIDLRAEKGKVWVHPIEKGEEDFGAMELRRDLLTSYKRNYAEFQQLEGPRQRINAVYDALHTAYYELKAQTDKRLFLSFGLLSGKGYRNFLFHIPLRLELQQQELRLITDTLTYGISCEQSFTGQLENWFPHEPEHMIEQRQQQVLQEVDAFHSEPKECNFDPQYLKHSFYEAAIKILSVFPSLEDRFFANGELNYDLPSAESDRMVLSFSPVVQVRSLDQGIHISQDAANIMSRIHQLGSEGANDQIPDYFKKLFSLRKEGNPLRIAYRKMDMAAPVRNEPLPRPDRFLFPLPYNDEQMAIAERLLEQDAVIVKGPPGTGKSHTIANLTSHFVAEGKSILIVSKNAKALEVIRGKLPEEIRHLAVSLVNEDPQQEGMKHAIDGIKDHLSRTYTIEEVDQLEDELKALEAQFNVQWQEVIAQVANNAAQLEIYDPLSGKIEQMPVAHWIKRLAESANRESFIFDVITHESETEGLSQALTALADQLNQADVQLLRFDWPTTDNWPRPESLVAVLEEKEKLLNQFAPEAFQGLDPAYFDEAFLQEWEIVKERIELLNTQQSWLGRPGFKADDLRVFLA
ncbi:MAG: AAA domain-containing protein, partial [Bacteroidota bacterium]